MNKPELILPAGSPEKMRFAFMYGADAVYLGLVGFSLRARVNDFTKDSMKECIEEAHALGKKVYVTINIYPRNVKIDAFIKHIKWLAEIKPDAVIVANMGVFNMVKEYYPDAKIHISVQATSLNYKDVEFWKNAGAKRVILSRELSIEEVREIKKRVPDIEIEFFVHGAVCIAYSGRCLMSNYFTMRESNQGACAHSCRWKYKTYLEEDKRPGEMLPIEEDENGTYLFNAKDLCALPYLKELHEAGVTGFKVEGRSKSIYYLSTVASTYRKAIDDMLNGSEYDPSLLDELKKIAHRGYSPGFLHGPMTDQDIYYEKNEPLQTHKFIGVVRKQRSVKSRNLYEIEIRNRIESGTQVEIMMPGENKQDEILNILDLEKNPVEAAHGGAGIKLIELKSKIPEGAFIRQKFKLH